MHEQPTAPAPRWRLQAAPSARAALPGARRGLAPAPAAAAPPAEPSALSASDEPEAEDGDGEDEDAPLMDADARRGGGAFPRAPFLLGDALGGGGGGGGGGGAFPTKTEELSGAAPTLSLGLAGPLARPLSAVPHVIRRRNVGVPKFLRYLFQILELEDPEVITWAHAGTAFQIRRPDALAESVLPKYFKHNKVSSFQRQLNYFGFKKWTKTQTNVCTFSHPFFLRDDKDKMKLIKRKERANVHAIGPFAAYVLPTGAARSFSAGAVTVSAAAAAAAMPRPAAVKRQKSSSAVLSPREDRAPVAFLGSAAAGRRYSTGALPGADGMAAMSVESLFLQAQGIQGAAYGSPYGSAASAVAAAPSSSFLAASLTTPATRKRAAEVQELETNPFQQSSYLFGAGFGLDAARDVGPLARQTPAARIRNKRKSLPTPHNPHRQSNIFSSGFTPSPSASAPFHTNGSDGSGSSAPGLLPVAFKFEPMPVLDYSAPASQADFQSRALATNASGAAAGPPSHAPQPQPQSQPKDYIDVLLESAALDDAMEPAFSATSSAMGPFSMAQRPPGAL